MTRVLVSLLLVVGSVCARAEGRDRVVVADSDPELRRAMEYALRPWKLEVIFEDDAPLDIATAEQRARDSVARFVVWRDAGQLVVYDNDGRSEERRDSRSGVLDPVSAAAAALTIKTMMRLPPLPTITITTTAPPADSRAPVDTRVIELRILGRSALRFAPGVQGSVGRFAGFVMLRPLPSTWRFGVAAELGTGVAVDAGNFKGDWNESSGIAVASWTSVAGPIEVEPLAGAGITYSVLDGLELATTRRREARLLPTARVGVATRWRVGDAWTLGIEVSAQGMLRTPSYRNASTSLSIFDIPSWCIDAAFDVAFDH